MQTHALVKYTQDILLTHFNNDENCHFRAKRGSRSDYMFVLRDLFISCYQHLQTYVQTHALVNYALVNYTENILLTP